jgi:hypothetical protein
MVGVSRLLCLDFGITQFVRLVHFQASRPPRSTILVDLTTTRAEAIRLPRRFPEYLQHLIRLHLSEDSVYMLATPTLQAYFLNLHLPARSHTRTHTKIKYKKNGNYTRCPPQEAIICNIPPLSLPIMTIPQPQQKRRRQNGPVRIDSKNESVSASSSTWHTITMSDSE